MSIGVSFLAIGISFLAWVRPDCHHACHLIDFAVRESRASGVWLSLSSRQRCTRGSRPLQPSLAANSPCERAETPVRPHAGSSRRRECLALLV